MSIETDYDIAFVAGLALREKQIQQNYRPIIAVHKWFARRPGTLFRALTLSEFGGASLEDLFFTANDFAGRKIADPFMGGGTPLIEANRVGCLRMLATRCSDPRQTRRLLALAAVYDGMSRADAAKVGGMDRQTLRDWVHRFNESGPDGLTNRRGQARPRRLSEAQMRELAEMVETGPDPAVDGVVRWRRVDLKWVIEERFGVVY